MPQEITIRDRKKPYVVATKDELLEFANRLRLAGGGEIINDLLPSKSGDPHSCLIARAVNFESHVDVLIYGSDNIVDGSNIVDVDTHIWGMSFNRYDVEHLALGRRIAKLMDLKWNETRSAIELPIEIGNVAFAFDAGELFSEYDENDH